jgi:hypothetical protein
VVRIGPNEVSLDDPEAVKQIYGHATEFKKALWYYASGGIHPEHTVDLFTDTDEKNHSKNRYPSPLEITPTPILSLVFILRRIPFFGFSGPLPSSPHAPPAFATCDEIG